MKYPLCYIGFCCFVSMSLAPFSQLQAEQSGFNDAVANLQAVIEAQRQQMSAMAERMRAMEARIVQLEDAVAAQPQSPGQAGLQRQAAAAAPQSPQPAPGPAVAPALPLATPASSARFPISFYGYIKLDAAYDTHKTTPGNYAFRVLPQDGRGSDGEFNLTAKQTRLGARVQAADWDEWKLRGQVEIDFYGSASDTAANPRLRLANITIENDRWQWLLGQAYDTWFLTTPQTVNFASFGQHGSLWSRRPLAQGTRKLALSGEDRLHLSVGLARTVGGDRDGLGQDDGADSGLPTLQFNAVYHTQLAHGPARFALGGHYGRETVDLLGKDSHDFLTTLLIFSFQMPLSTQLSLAGSAWTGENLGGYLGGIGQTINLSRNTEIAARGGWLQLGWAPSQVLRFHLFAGVDDPANKDLDPGMRSRNASIGSNVFWNATSYLTFALEYQYMQTEYFRTEEAASHRLQSAVLLKF